MPITIEALMDHITAMIAVTYGVPIVGAGLLVLAIVIAAAEFFSRRAAKATTTRYPTGMFLLAVALISLSAVYYFVVFRLPL
jgi:cation transport ATPase